MVELPKKTGADQIRVISIRHLQFTPFSYISLQHKISFVEKTILSIDTKKGEAFHKEK
jgi:hypothetical protein